MNQLEVGKKIRRLREKKAWTQEHLAQAASISLRTVQRAEEGTMSAETLAAVAGAFDVEVTELTRTEPSYPSVCPFLYYAKPGSFDWLVRVFGFSVRMKIPGPNDTVVHGELTLGNGLVMVGLPSESDDAKTPEQAGCRTQGLYLMVDDADAHCERARGAGAKIVSEPREAHGHRRYVAEDPEGHRWMFASPISI
ncbi:VOC family protein [Pendulispora brunnea]|uniref:VOC family protein n=1 Tax=Pendulispora brunnea TaxID=2905690 RepID=A0ABZ2KHB3_9BACT